MGHSSGISAFDPQPTSANAFVADKFDNNGELCCAGESCFSSPMQRRGDAAMPSTNSDQAREALTAAFDAMSAWRTEVEKTNEKSTARVIEKVGDAAEALGWPKQIVDAARLQMQTMGKMQLQTIDGMMNTWREQIRSPSQASELLSKLSSMPNFGAGANGNMNPFEMYMQFAEQWQKAWRDGLALWSGTGKGMTT
jgi:hypothetical protein